MYKLRPSTKFQKDVKRMKKRGADMEALNHVLKILAEGKELAPKYRNHTLSGNFANCQECHIMADWLLIYEIHDRELYLYLVRTGSHSDLF